MGVYLGTSRVKYILHSNNAQTLMNTGKPINDVLFIVPLFALCSFAQGKHKGTHYLYTHTQALGDYLPRSNPPIS